MSIDLQDLFNEEGLAAPPAKLDTDYVIRRGRRVRARRRAIVGTTAFVGVGVVAVGSVALAGNTSFGGHAQPGVGAAAGSGLNASTTVEFIGTSSPPPAVTPSVSPVPDLSATPPALAVTPSGTPSPSGTSVAQGTPPADLAAVALANPAPGFPVRRWKDDVTQESTGPGTRWVAEFGLAVRPELTPTASPGVVLGQANGPEVSIFVGDYSTPIHLSGLKSRPVSGSPAVAGVVGHLAEYTEKGTTFSVLYFSTGKFTVEIIGSGVTTAQLVALGDALTGLQ
jgi:hypothetical protein